MADETYALIHITFRKINSELSRSIWALL